MAHPGELGNLAVGSLITGTGHLLGILGGCCRSAWASVVISTLRRGLSDWVLQTKW